MNALAEKVRVDAGAIEKSLADVWRREHGRDQGPVTRAALWNVIAHTASAGDQTRAGEVLRRAAASVPQRTILIRSERGAPSDIASWISANCHMLGSEKQVCSEQVAIVAGGESVERVPPLVNALLMPDMPVALWWIGRMPEDEPGYLDGLLDPVDRLIVDSSDFRSADELDVIRCIAERTATAPADLNWVRLEGWRAATATLFDPPVMRSRLNRIRSVRLELENSMQSVLYVSWLAAQAGEAFRSELTDDGVARVEITFDDGNTATMELDEQRQVVLGRSDVETSVDCVTRTTSRSLDDLLIRQLERPQADPVFIRALPIAVRMLEAK